MSTARAAAVTILVLGVVFLAACTGAEARRESYIKRGQEYFATGDYARAGVEFRNAMQVMPKDPQARVLAGEAQEQLGQYRNAAGLFQSVIESNPDNVRARVDFAQMYEYAHLPQSALKLLAPVLAKHPDDAHLLTARGLARSQLKDYAGAMADAQRAVQLDPTYTQAVGLLAGLYRRDNQDVQAAALVEGALKKLPQSTQLREVLIEMYMQTGDDARAEKQLRQLIAMRPANLQYRAELAQIDVRENQLDQAETVLRGTVQAAPASDDAKLMLVKFLADHRSPALGDGALRTFIAAEPDDTRLRLALGAMLERTGQSDQALLTYGEVVRREGDDPSTLSAEDRIAAIYMAAGRNDEAAAEIAKVLSRDSGNDPALTMRGSLELASGHPAAAITDFRAVLRNEPGLVAVHRLLARALITNGDTALAEDELQTAIQSAPDDPETRLELGQVYLQSGDTDRAVTVLEQGVQQLPTNGPMREALVRAYIAKRDFQSATAQVSSMTVALPQSGAGPYLEGLVAVAQKQYAPAEADFELALQRQPKAVAPLLDLIHLQASRHEIPQAEQRLQRMVHDDPADALALELLGELDFAQKAYPRAIAEASQAARISPGLWYAYRTLALAKAAAGDMAGAVAAYQAAIRAAPGQPEPVAELASYYVRVSQPAHAIELYEAFYQREPRSLDAANNLALLLATYNSDAQSLARARNLTAAFASSDNSTLLDTNGWVLLRSGDLSRAMPLLQRAAAQDPASGLVHYHLAMAELAAGERTKGQADLKTALAGSPSFPGVTDARSKLAGLQPGAG